jgi:hypothetical protein
MSLENSLVGFGVLTEMVMKSSTFKDTIPCSLLNINQTFRGTSHHLQSKKEAKQESRGKEGGQKNFAGFLPGVFFNPKEGGNLWL